jgi:CBS domain-containing protein
MSHAFNFSASPFDCLSLQEQQLVQQSVAVLDFQPGQTILELHSIPTHLFVLISGRVTQQDGDEIITTYGPGDSFDARGLVVGRVSGHFVAVDAVQAYQLALPVVNALIASNAAFGALLFADLSHKLQALAERTRQHELQSLTLSRVDEAFLRPAHFVDYATDVLSVVQLFQARRTANVLVRDTRAMPHRLGIFTATTLQRAVLDGRPLDQLAVGELANFSLVEVSPSGQLGDAMALMLRRRVHRLVVVQAGAVLGILEALDLFSFLSNQSHLITVEIEQAIDLTGLSAAAARITRMMALLYRNGTRVNLIAQLVQQLNARLFERAWQLVAPPDLVANSCLFVMGSEGRGEQLLKTDQDNGLILRDGYVPPADLATICERFSGALAGFGYPPCPGFIMVSNPQWCQSGAEFTRMARQWLMLPNADSLMNLAIFMDAHAVCGDVSLLDAVRHSLAAMATDNDVMLNRFAAAIDAFGSGGGWWTRLLGLGETEQPLNLKKEGIFPLVHGVRSLALAHHVLEVSTTERLAALVQSGYLEATLGADLTESLHFFMGLKLKVGLAELEQQQPVTGAIDMARLSGLDRDLLKDTLAVVKRFKTLLRLRFYLQT